MGFSFKVAPGIRVRASSRGVRTSIGPRVARVHVGGGRTGFSTGVGPVSYYTSVGGSRPRNTAGSRPRAAAQPRRTGAGLTANQASRLHAAQQLESALQGIYNLHRHEFAPMQRPTAPPAEPVDVEAIRRDLRTQNLTGVKLLARAERKAARAEADRAADALAARRREEREQQRTEIDKNLGEWWNQLLANEPTVTETLVREAFEDNDAPAGVLLVENDMMSLVVVVPDESVVPDRRPTTTAAGNLSLQRLSKTDRDQLYKEVVCGSTLVTVREALAVAPAINHIRIVAVRTTEKKVFGGARIDALLAAGFTRATLDRVDWANATATTIVGDASDELVVSYKGATKTISPLDLATEPDVAQLVSAIELDDLT
jgi:hypothetical protein